MPPKRPAPASAAGDFIVPDHEDATNAPATKKRKGDAKVDSGDKDGDGDGDKRGTAAKRGGDAKAKAKAKVGTGTGVGKKGDGKGKGKRGGGGDGRKLEGDEDDGDDGEVPGGGTRDGKGDEFWEISGKRRVAISLFGGKRMVSVREYYEKNGESLPGKKGISLTLDQFNAVIELLPHIESVLVGKGDKVSRPDYTVQTEVNTREEDNDDEEDEEQDEETVIKKKNFEETSEDEEE